MSNRVIKILIYCCLGLLVISLTEWGVAEYSKRQLLNSLSNNDNQSYMDNKLPEFNLFSMSEETYTEMIERPLFIQGRRPIITEETTDVKELDTGKIDDWVLVGIYSNEDKLTGLFRSLAKQGKHLKKIQGEDISGWVLKEIQTDRIVLEQAGKLQTLMLRKPKPMASKKTKPVTRQKRKPKSRKTE